MDHSVAVVRRYPEVKLYHDDNFEYGHAGMVVHPDKRILYIANPASGNIVAVHIDTARYSRTARDEYPSFQTSCQVSNIPFMNALIKSKSSLLDSLNQQGWH